MVETIKESPMRLILKYLFSILIQIAIWSTISRALDTWMFWFVGIIWLLIYPAPLKSWWKDVRRND